MFKMQEITTKYDSDIFGEQTIYLVMNILGLKTPGGYVVEAMWN